MAYEDSSWSILPKEIMLKIFSGLPSTDLACIRQVCKYWCTSAGELICKLKLQVNSRRVEVDAAFFERFPCVTHLELVFSADAVTMDQRDLLQLLKLISTAWALKSLTLSGPLPQMMYGYLYKQVETFGSLTKYGVCLSTPPNWYQASPSTINSIINYDIFAATSAILPPLTFNTDLGSDPMAENLASWGFLQRASSHALKKLPYCLPSVTLPFPPTSNPFACYSPTSALSALTTYCDPLNGTNEWALIQKSNAKHLCIPVLGLFSSVVQLHIHDQRGFPPPHSLGAVSCLPLLELLDLTPTRPLLVDVGELVAGLRSLSLGDPHMAALAGATRLTELRLGCAHHLTGGGIEKLCGFKDLRMLDLGEGINAATVSGQNMQNLGALPHLAHLALSRVSPPPTLVLGIMATRAHAWAPLLFSSGFTSLTRLDLTLNHSLEPQLLLSTACLSCLTSLHLHLSDLPYADLNAAFYALPALKALQSLKLSNLLLCDVHLVMISAATQITALEMKQVDVRARDIHIWAILSSLISLRIFSFVEWNNPLLSVGNLATLTDEVVSTWATSWRCLTHLSYRGRVTITDAAADALALMTELVEVAIYGSDGTTCTGLRTQLDVAAEARTFLQRAQISAAEAAAAASAEDTGRSTDTASQTVSTLQHTLPSVLVVSGSATLIEQTACLGSHTKRRKMCRTNGSLLRRAHLNAERRYPLSGRSLHDNSSSLRPNPTMDVRLLLPVGHVASRNGFVGSQGPGSPYDRSEDSDCSVNWDG